MAWEMSKHWCTDLGHFSFSIFAQTVFNDLLRCEAVVSVSHIRLGLSCGWVHRVGENAPAMKKGQVTAHKPAVGALFKVRSCLHARSDVSCSCLDQ